MESGLEKLQKDTFEKGNVYDASREIRFQDIDDISTRLKLYDVSDVLFICSVRIYTDIKKMLSVLNSGMDSDISYGMFEQVNSPYNYMLDMSFKRGAISFWVIKKDIGNSIMIPFTEGEVDPGKCVLFNETN